MQGQPKNVRQVQGTFRAFAAILADGSVITWGDPDDAGDSTTVQVHAQQVQATESALAAVLSSRGAIQNLVATAQLSKTNSRICRECRESKINFHHDFCSMLDFCHSL